VVYAKKGYGAPEEKTEVAHWAELRNPPTWGMVKETLRGGQKGVLESKKGERGVKGEKNGLEIP